MTQEPNIFPYIARLLQGTEVVWKPLGEVLLSVRTGLNPRQFFTLNTENAKNYYINIRELRGGKIIPSDKTDKMNDEALKLCQKRSNLEVGDILFSGTGTIGEMAIIKEEPTNWNIKEGVYSLKPNLFIVTSGYICHILNSQEIKNKILNKSVGGTVKSIPMKELQQIQIPLPPLSVQQEIVRILDKFTQLEAELEAELDCRKRQYEYYRNKLLSYEGNEVEWKTLGEVGTFIRGNGLQKKDFVETGIGCIHYGQIYTYYGIKASKIISYVTEDLAKSLRKASHNDLIIAAVSENIEDVCKCVVWEGEEDICVSGDTFIFKTDQNPHYIGHLLRTDNFLNYKRKNAVGAKVTRLQAGSLPKYAIPLPQIEEQNRIVAILDKFDTLVNSISEGLPKEIALRRKQYEYYREKLLSFPS